LLIKLPINFPIFCRTLYVSPVVLVNGGVLKRDQTGPHYVGLVATISYVTHVQTPNVFL